MNLTGLHGVFMNFFLRCMTNLLRNQEKANLAELLETPKWMDKDGKEVKEDDVFGCKVTHNILHPYMCLVMDEVGGNTNQKGYGNVGGQLQLCKREMTPQENINTKDKHYTLLGITTMTGEPVVCIVICSSIQPNAMVETGLDLMAETIGSAIDDNFFEKNSGKGKKFPGGPTCKFEGKQIPCLCRWSKKG